MEQDVKLAFDDTLSRFAVTLSTFSEQNLNKSANPPGSWTAAQVADHVLKSLAGFPGLMNGKSEENSREPEEKRQAISNVFLDFSNKMKSPDFILPSDDALHKAELLQRIANISEQIAEETATKDLTRIYSSFELPGFGPFSGLEWLWFAVCHTERHHQQLLKISQLQSGLK